MHCSKIFLLILRISKIFILRQQCKPELALQIKHIPCTKHISARRAFVRKFIPSFRYAQELQYTDQNWFYFWFDQNRFDLCVEPLNYYSILFVNLTLTTLTNVNKFFFYLLDENTNICILHMYRLIMISDEKRKIYSICFTQFCTI